MDRERFKVEFLPEAQKNIEDITAFIARDNPERAYSYAMELSETAKSLEYDPFIGHEYKRAEQEDLRVVNHGNYQIIYKVLETERIIEKNKRSDLLRDSRD